MPSHALQIRLWLDRNGLTPRSRLAVLTCYLLGLDILLFVAQKVSAALHKHFGEFLGGWVIFLSLVTLVLLLVLVGRRVSARLLWRLRNRLVVTYIFIGVIPLVLLVVLGLGTFYLFAGQFAAFVATSRLNTELSALKASSEILARSLAADLEQSRLPGASRAIAANGEVTMAAWLENKPIITSSVTGAAIPFPQKFPGDFKGVVRDSESVYVRAITRLTTAQGKLTVVASAPFDSKLLLSIATGFGVITAGELEPDSGRLLPKSSVGTVPPASRWVDIQVPAGTHLPTQNWATGQSAPDLGFTIVTRLSQLYRYLFSELGDVGATFEFSLLLLLLVLGIFEIVAAYIGARLTTTVTASVGQLYLGTTFVNRADFSHRIPITSSDQLATLAHSFNLMTESIEKLVLEQKEKQRLQNEITIAQEVQNQLFPRRLSHLANLEVHGFCRPARSVSGDYYDFLPSGAERLILAVGDVSGKGISAALLMATIHSAVRAYSLEGIPVFRQVEAVGAGGAFAAKYDQILPGAEVSPGTMLSLLNHQLYHSTPLEKYATLFLAMYEADQRRLTYSNAGHLPPLLIAPDGSCRRLQHGGTVVGLFDDLTYDERAVNLNPGDIFLAYSDGVTEPENEFGEFGEERLLELVQENRDLPLAKISEVVTAAVDDWIGAAEQPDDVTLVLARAR